jgi:hypothetical protein
VDALVRVRICTASESAPGRAQGEVEVARRACRKKRYGTRREAEASIDGMARKFGSLLFKKPYWCGKCKAWHLTSTPAGGGPRRVKH